MAEPEPSATHLDPGAAPGRLRALAGEVSGAFADLGTFLPLVVGVIAVQRLDATGVLVGFGLFALAVAAIYRRPVPVQPMKAVAAVAIAGGLSPGATAASGLLIGLTLVVLALTGVVAKLARLVPQSVLAGIQLGVGVHLALAGLALAREDLVLGGLALAVLLLMRRGTLKPLAGITVVAGAAAWALAAGVALPSVSVGLHWPELALPQWSGFLAAAESVVLPQLALTLTNAVLVTATIAASLFPGDTDRITPRRLALSSGVLNVLLAPLGAFPMCHGAGGLVVQHRFGARTGLAPALFGLGCLALGIGLGADALALLAFLPLAAVGALLVAAGVELAVHKRLFDSRPSCLVVIVLTAAVCVTVNVAAGLAVGWVAEILRTLALRRGGYTACS